MGTAKNLLCVFIRKKPIDMFLAINSESRGNYCSKLAAKANLTYSHGNILLSELKEAGLLTFEKCGRIKQIKLTKKGIEFSKNLKEFMELAGENYM